MKEISKINLHSDSFEQLVILYVFDSEDQSSILSDLEEYEEREKHILDLLNVEDESRYEIAPGAKYNSYEVDWSQDFKQTLVYHTIAYNV